MWLRINSRLSINEKPPGKCQFSENCGVTNYDGGWRKDVRKPMCGVSVSAWSSRCGEIFVVCERCAVRVNEPPACTFSCVYRVRLHEKFLRRKKINKLMILISTQNQVVFLCNETH